MFSPSPIRSLSTPSEQEQEQEQEQEYIRKPIHGTEPVYLIDKILRTRIYDSLYWKSACFSLSAATLLVRAHKIAHIGGFWGNNTPTQFISLILKLLSIQPETEIILEYIKQPDFKYIRALGAFYIRMTMGHTQVYNYLEPLLIDYRKLRYRGNGKNTQHALSDVHDLHIRTVIRRAVQNPII